MYRALDTIEGVAVALKIPHTHLVDESWMRSFRAEVRLTAKLDHPNIVVIKNAGFIGERFVVATPLAAQALSTRLERRLAPRVALDFAQDMLAGLAFAHRQRVIHCDIKPDNFLIFDGPRIRLADFGIARVLQRTVSASGSGTLGYMAPEQAMGAPSPRSDVFSLGLVFYEMFSGDLPRWPFKRPLPGLSVMRSRMHREVVDLVLKAIDLDPARRFRDAAAMLKAFERAKSKALRQLAGEQRRKTVSAGAAPRNDWGKVRWRQFRRQFGKALEIRGECPRCEGPISEAMRACPWCAERLTRYRGSTRWSRRCQRCRRGMKPDWRFCPWCWGGEVPGASTREYGDVRYSARCANRVCQRKRLMPFMRYCPWCRRKVTKAWSLPGFRGRCGHCGGGIAGGFWDFCAWCGETP